MNTLNWRKRSNIETLNVRYQARPAQQVEKKSAKAISLCTFFIDAVN
ncbi:MAG: hypothetical protein RLZZ433_1473 [Pseudomonadota bacterium]|jgi:hypothetical protein